VEDGEEGKKVDRKRKHGDGGEGESGGRLRRQESCQQKKTCGLSCGGWLTRQECPQKKKTYRLSYGRWLRTRMSPEKENISTELRKMVDKASKLVKKENIQIAGKKTSGSGRLLKARMSPQESPQKKKTYRLGCGRWLTRQECPQKKKTYRPSYGRWLTRQVSW